MAKPIKKSDVYFKVTGDDEAGGFVILGFTDDPQQNAIYYIGGGWKVKNLRYTPMLKQPKKLFVVKKEIKKEIKDRLEYLRGEIKAERISYGEIAELQGLAEYIEDDDVELLEWAGVSEEEYNSRRDKK